MASLTVTEVLAFLPFHSALTVALPPTLPEAVKRPPVVTEPISPRSSEKTAGTWEPPLAVATNCTVAAGSPVNVTTGSGGVIAKVCASRSSEPSMGRIGGSTTEASAALGSWNAESTASSPHAATRPTPRTPRARSA
jgi:hypothetical protein